MKYIFAYVLRRYAITYIHTYTYKFLGQKVQSQFVGLVPCRFLAYTLLGVPLSPCTASRQILVESERCSSSLRIPHRPYLISAPESGLVHPSRCGTRPSPRFKIFSVPSLLRHIFAFFSFTTKEAEIPHL